jgi:hypothetical protein
MAINVPSSHVHSSSAASRANAAQPLAASTMAFFADILTQGTPLAKRARGNSQPPPLTRSSTPYEAELHEFSASYCMSHRAVTHAHTYKNQRIYQENTHAHAEGKPSASFAPIDMPPHPAHLQQVQQASEDVSSQCFHADEHRAESFDLTNMLPVAAPPSESPWLPALSLTDDSGSGEEEEGGEQEGTNVLLDEFHIPESLEGLGETLDFF